MLPPPTIITIPSKKLMGQRVTMSFSNNQTFKLWNTFMPRRSEIPNTIGSNLYSLQVYPEGFFENFNPNTNFVKWAAVEVNEYGTEGMEIFDLPGGQYAIFHYKGSSENAAKVFSYILQEWLPKSGYRLDERPHFEILGQNYRQGDPNSEEEIWIPVV